MAKNEEDILLEASNEDKVVVLRALIDSWQEAADNSSNVASRQYCLGRAHGLAVCLPAIKKLVGDYNEAEIARQLEGLD